MRGHFTNVAIDFTRFKCGIKRCFYSNAVEPATRIRLPDFNTNAVEPATRVRLPDLHSTGLVLSGTHEMHTDGSS